ncbi:MAG TPA: type II secretion system protein N [Sulfuricaulis sp.]
MSKRRWLLYSIFGFIFYLLFLIIELPASWFAWGLNRYTQGSVQIDPFAGSLWNGKGRLIVYYPSTTPHDLGQAKWQINPFWLLTGLVQVTLQTNQQDKRITTTLQLTKASFKLLDTDIEFPAAFLGQLHAPLSLISPQGSIKINTTGLLVAAGTMRGAAMLEWLNAGSGLSSVQPLGDFRLDITAVDKIANLKLTTLRGDLELTGQGQWQLRTGQLQISGFALPRARVGELESLLRMLGHDEGGGKRTLNINTRLPPMLASN